MRTFVGLEDSAKRRTLHRDDPSAASLRRIKVAMAGLVVVIGFGTAGYLFLPVEAGRHQFGPLDALYQTVTTVATVGFREVHPLNHQGQIFTMLLIILGAGTVLYNLGLLVEAVTEGKLRQHLERRRMDKTIGDMRDHVIICGFGRVGKAAAEHLVATGNQVVVIDRDPIRLAEHDEIPHLIGEATGDDILRAAGIERARALVASLDTDAETVYLVLSARALASLSELIRLTETLLTTGTLGLFPKGQDVGDELTEASKYWRIQASMVASSGHTRWSGSHGLSRSVPVTTVSSDVGVKNRTPAHTPSSPAAAPRRCDRRCVSQRSTPWAPTMTNSWANGSAGGCASTSASPSARRSVRVARCRCKAMGQTLDSATDNHPSASVP